MPEMKISDERVLAAFVDKMITDKNALVTEKERTALYRVLREQLNVKIEQAMLSALSDEEMIKLNEMLDDGASDDEIEALFNESDADFARAVERALTEMRTDYLEHGDSDALIEQSKAQYAEFLATAPDGQGYPVGMDPREEQV
jgi:hypothetical protein